MTVTGFQFSDPILACAADAVGDISLRGSDADQLQSALCYFSVPVSRTGPCQGFAGGYSCSDLQSSALASTRQDVARKAKRCLLFTKDCRNAGHLGNVGSLDGGVVRCLWPGSLW